ncbi:MAG: NUDIX domain-containing protein [Chloroflexota bacterium]|nr:NUDIX domain-containing protein [Chloroflexota bacterium]
MPASDQGVSHERYTLIPRTLIFVTYKDEVLLLRGASDKRLWANRYNGIGGHIEPGEDVLTAAYREFREETGISPPDLWLCGTITISTGRDVGVGIYVFSGEILEKITLQSTEEGAPTWIPSENIQTIPLVEDLYTLLPKILAMRKGDPPFSAHYHYDENDQLVIDFSI